tara:strand:- start:191 stop:394 length:204 start_codon:yes stop_codon:yes gene_type:complete
LDGNKPLRKRRILKTITWRTVATSITVVVAYILTGRLEIAGSIGLLDGSIKMVSYYAHESIWDKIKI